MNDFSANDIIFLSIAGSLLFLFFVIFIASMVALFLKRKQQQQLELQSLRHDYEVMVNASKLEIQEQTLKNISEEIHDNIGQMLSLAKLQLHALDNEIGHERTKDIASVVGNALSDLRSLSRSLHPDRIAGMPLYESVEQELEILSRTGKLQAAITHEDIGPQLQPQQRIVLFRIFQEIMSNTIRHAEATTFHVHMNNSPERLLLTAVDNGKGFLQKENNGIGLLNMQERASLIGATMEVNSTPGKGTTIVITLPHPTMS